MKIIKISGENLPGIILDKKSKANGIKKFIRAGERILCFDIGTIHYTDAFKLQQEIYDLVFADKIKGVILLLEHFPVVTIGNNNNRLNLLADEKSLKAQNIEMKNRVTNFQNYIMSLVL